MPGVAGVRYRAQVLQLVEAGTIPKTVAERAICDPRKASTSMTVTYRWEPSRDTTTLMAEAANKGTWRTSNSGNLTTTFDPRL